MSQTCHDAQTSALLSALGGVAAVFVVLLMKSADKAKGRTGATDCNGGCAGNFILDERPRAVSPRGTAGRGTGRSTYDDEDYRLAFTEGEALEEDNLHW